MTHQPVVSPPSAPTSAPPARASRRWVAIVVIAVVLLAGAGIALARMGVLSFRRANPEDVLRNAFLRMIDADTTTYTGSLNLGIERVDATDPFGTIRALLTFSGTTATDPTGLEQSDVEYALTVDAASDLHATTNAEFRTIGAISYARLNDLTVQMTDPQYATIVGAIAGSVKGAIGGKWITIDPKAIAALAKQERETITLPGIPTDDETRAFTVEARTMLRAHSLFAFDQDLGMDRLDGMRMEHYRVHVRRDELLALVDAFAHHPFLVRSPMDSDTIASIREAIAGDVGAELAATRLEVWIDAKEGTFRRVLIPITHTIPNAPLTADGGTQKVRLSGAFDTRFIAWNTPVTIAAPVDAIPLEELLTPFLGGARGVLGESPVSLDASTAGANTDRDHDGLSDADERGWGTDPTKRDTDGDGFFDGEEVKNGYNPRGAGRVPTLQPIPKR